MSHYLSKIRIRNYRSIKEIELHLESYCPLVGANNAGKSNILNAIQWFLKPEKLEKSHFNIVSEPLEMEGEIAGITEDLFQALPGEHAKRLRPLVRQERLVMRRVMTTPGPATSAKLEIQKPETGNFEPPPTGFPATVLELFPEPVRVEAMVDASEDAAKNKSTTTLGKLINLLADPIKKGPGERLDEIYTEVEKLLSADGEDRAEELKEFDERANEAITDFFPGIELNVQFAPPTVPDLLKNGTLRIREAGVAVDRKFEELGHGAQRSIHMALVQVLATRAREAQGSSRCRLFLIDEPELYLHPQAIETVRTSLKRLAGNGYQVVFSTHSPFLIDREDLPYVNMISKPDASLGTQVNARAEDAIKTINDAEKQAQVLFELGNSREILFCDRVLLVEGKTEPQLMADFYTAVTGKTLLGNKIGVVRLSGCGDTKKAMEVLEAMGVKVRALVDLDFLFRQAVRSRIIAADHPGRVAVKRWFSVSQAELGAELCQEGLPKNCDAISSEEAFARMAADAENGDAIEGLHAEVRKSGIWAWRKGSIEQVLGIRNKNDPNLIRQKCEELRKNGRGAIAEAEESEAFCEWLHME